MESLSTDKNNIQNFHILDHINLVIKLFMLVNSKMDRDMEEVFNIGKMDQHIWETGNMILLKEREG